MRETIRRVVLGLLAAAAMTLISCGGGKSPGGSATPAAGTNVLPVVVDSGPNGNSVNTVFTSVTLCVPGSTTQCQTIDHIQVDTGSNGLRILGSVLLLSLPLAQAADGNTLSECTQFVDGISWGPLASADVQLSGEKAESVPIQVIGATGFIAPPAACTGLGMEEDTVSAFGANGILGVGVFEQDCGTECANNAASGYYYSCAQTACMQIAAPLASQVLNPVALLVTDNNGSIIDLPAVASPGAAAVNGSLIFGIDTQTNNASGKQTLLTLDAGFGYFTTVFAGQTLQESFIDSGTNGLFFNAGNITQCSGANFSGFYCPPASQSFSAMLTGTNGTSVTTRFSIDNAQTVASNEPRYTALPGLGGIYATAGDTFDWGLPFFYGRRVATALESRSSAVGTGPYVAF